MYVNRPIYTYVCKSDFATPRFICTDNFSFFLLSFQNFFFCTNFLRAKCFSKLFSFSLFRERKTMKKCCFLVSQLFSLLTKHLFNSLLFSSRYKQFCNRFYFDEEHFFVFITFYCKKNQLFLFPSSANKIEAIFLDI